MRSAVAVVVAIVLGFVLGGIGPRRELVQARAQIADLESRVTVAEKKAARRPSDRFLGLPALPLLPPPTPRPATKTAEADASATPSPDASPVDRMKEFQLAVDAQRLRASQSRAALVEAAHLDAKAQASVDDVVAKMNAELAQHAQEIASMMQAMADGQDPDPQELLSITHDVSGILLDSQSAFQQATGGIPSGVDPSATQVWNYVDLSIFQSVIANMPVPNAAASP